MDVKFKLEMKFGNDKVSVLFVEVSVLKWVVM